MVSSLSLFFMLLTAFITLIMPIIVAILYYRRTKYNIGSLFIGAGVFFLFQIIFRIPILQLVLPKMQWYLDLAKQIVPYALFLGFTAGLVEEVGRYIAFKTLLKRKLNRKNAIAFGMGHGGIEAILLIGMAYINNIFMSILINSNTFDQVIGKSLPLETITQIKTSLIDTDSFLFLVGGIERILTFIIHIGFSVLIMVGIRRGKGIQYMILAIFLHMLLDSSVVLLAQNGLSIWMTEIYIALFTVIALIFMIIVKKKANYEESPSEVVELP